MTEYVFQKFIETHFYSNNKNVLNIDEAFEKLKSLARINTQGADISQDIIDMIKQYTIVPYWIDINSLDIKNTEIYKEISGIVKNMVYSYIVNPKCKKEFLENKMKFIQTGYKFTSSIPVYEKFISLNSTQSDKFASCLPVSIWILADAKIYESIYNIFINNTKLVNDMTELWQLYNINEEW